MSRDDFLDAQYKISFTAGMNQRYHQARASRWNSYDRIAKIVVGILAVVGACLSAFAASQSQFRWDIASVVGAGAAALAAIALNMLPFGEWYSDHKALFQRWSDLREEVDSLVYDLSDTDPKSPLVERLKRLDAKVHRICGTEPLADRTLLEKCQDEEKQSRGEGDVAACAL